MPAREERLLGALSRAGPEQARRAREWVQDLIASGAEPASEMAHAFTSVLNSDGSPLQLCLSVDVQALNSTLVADPGSDQDTALGHHRHGMAALWRAAASTVDQAAQDRLTQACEWLLPDDVSSYPELAVGTLWLGLPLDGPGLGLYLNGAWGDGQTRWDRVFGWLLAQGVPEEASLASVTALRQLAHVSSVGVDTATGGYVRLKVYFRLDRLAPLADFGAALWAVPLIKDFLFEVVGDRQIPSAGLVFCVSFLPGQAEVVDVKVDVCGHCLGDQVDWHCLDRVADLVGTRQVDWSAWDLGRATQVAFLGLGSRRDGSARWNVYLKGAS